MSNEVRFPTIVIQFKADGNLPPDMTATPGDLAMFLAQGIAIINEQEHVNADISYGYADTSDVDPLRETLENNMEDSE
jgi:hypothetical protein|tara:strand:+ start:2925 stop:3158 length:234 start_codon:yes stop_codon:yes gene_type:complete